MRRVKELLRLAHELGYSKRQIAVSIRMPKTTVNDYVFVPLVVFLVIHLATKTGVYDIDSTALATIIAFTGTRSLPVWPNVAGPRWAGSSVSSCTSFSTTTMKSSP
jgi:hypothetical protein